MISELVTDTGSLTLPTFFASISSVKTSLRPEEYLRVIRASSCPALLLSAFDLDHVGPADEVHLRLAIIEAMNSGKVVLFDSGNYESYWKEKTSTWSQERFHQVLASYPCSCALSFDVKNFGEPVERYAEMVAESLSRDVSAAGGPPVYPIVHGSGTAFPQICARVYQRTRARMIAIPERELGTGITERSRNLHLVWKQLATSGYDCGIHLLGTGNPLSMRIYAACGASSFDGLEWCQTAVDPQTALLHHLSLGELFVPPASSSAIGTMAATLLQNLAFFTTWMSKLRSDEVDAVPREIRELSDRVIREAQRA
jgi:queuine/archaeosine tRNA-ribosyltransferase